MTNDSKQKTPAWTSATSAATEKGAEEKKTARIKREKVTDITYTLVDQDKPNDVVNCGPEKPRFDTEKMRMATFRLPPDIYDLVRLQTGATSIITINALLRYAIDDLNEKKKKLIVK